MAALRVFLTTCAVAALSVPGGESSFGAHIADVTGARRQQNRPWAPQRGPPLHQGQHRMPHQQPTQGVPAGQPGQPVVVVTSGGTPVLVEMPGHAGANNTIPGSMPSGYNGASSYTTPAPLFVYAGPPFDAGHPGYPAPHAGHPGYPAPDGSHPGYPAPDGSDPGYPAPDGSDPGYPAPHASYPGYPAPHAGHPGYPTPHAGYPGYPAPHAGHPGYPTPHAGYPGYPAPGAGYGGYAPAAPGYPLYPAPNQAVYGLPQQAPYPNTQTLYLGGGERAPGGYDRFYGYLETAPASEHPRDHINATQGRSAHDEAANARNPGHGREHSSVVPPPHSSYVPYYLEGRAAGSNYQQAGGFDIYSFKYPQVQETEEELPTGTPGGATRGDPYLSEAGEAKQASEGSRAKKRVLALLGVAATVAAGAAARKAFAKRSSTEEGSTDHEKSTEMARPPPYADKPPSYAELMEELRGMRN
ncbi:hypothetical protein BESB_072290 [Besnoitia besnoiti]|uniref:Dense granule protein GRA4 n=1 Tax=Besnoitia besnoiti TaxID=94643 RepID=A0A2A9MEL9_BESBE|nr:uncharacterized protein BESB_072290 [Besnoitia besnoiti]PFH34077.1 hypothetical protein BESB_072290 [Besnoitia besnoiti]